MKHPHLEGILPVVPTPFNDLNQVDLDAVASVARFCIDAGAGGLVFPGVASEYDFLSTEEHHAALQVVCAEARGRVPVISGGGKGTPAEIAANVRKAQQFGAVAAMVLVPHRFAGDGAGALEFMLAVVEGAPGMDIILQNAPAPIGAGLEVADVIRIVNASPAIRYVKEESLPSGPRISGIRDAAPEHLVGVIGGGGARYLIDEMNRGAIGAMPAAEITDIHVKMWQAHRRGDLATARELYQRTLPLLVIQLIYRMRLTKHVLTLRGVLDNARVRAPLLAFDDYDLTEISTQLEGMSDLFSLTPGEEALR